MNEIVSILGGLKDLGKIFNEFKTFTLDIMDRISKRKDKKAVEAVKDRLIEIHKFSSGIGVGQRVYWEHTIQWYCKDPSEANWAEAKADLVKLLDKTENLRQVVDSAGDDFVIEGFYRDLLKTLEVRKFYLEKLTSMAAPTTKEELAVLKEIQQTYIQLMEDLEFILVEIEDFIKESE